MREDADYTLQFHSASYTWIKETQIILYFELGIMEIKGQTYACSVITQSGTDPVVTAPSPICTGYVESSKQYIVVTDYLVDQYSFNSVITLTLSGISNPRSVHVILGITFEIKTMLNNLLIDSGVTAHFNALSNPITNPSIVQSTNNRYESGSVDISFEIGKSSKFNF